MTGEIFVGTAVLIMLWAAIESVLSARRAFAAYRRAALSDCTDEWTEARCKEVRPEWKDWPPHA